MESKDIVKKKYKDLIPRSFKTKLEFFLFSKCIAESGIDNVSPEDFNWFEITDELVKVYEHAWTLGEDQRLKEGGLTMKEIEDKIESWNKNNSKLKAELLRQYKIYFITDYFPFSEFEKFYPLDPEKRICHYCKINDTEIENLEAKGQIKTIRPRGYTMEIDRLRAKYEYRRDNVVLACYWCNNAKSDEFSEPEFKDYIGPGIEKVWNERKKIL